MALVAWLLRLGFFADLLSRPVLVGCLAGKIGTELLFPTLPRPCRPTGTGRKTRRPATKAHDRGRSR
jgi:hypothetical protein